MYQYDVAKLYRISPVLVSKLVIDSERRPEKLRAKKAKEKSQAKALEATE